MNRLILSAAALLAAAPVCAGVRIESVSRNVQTLAVEGVAYVLLIQDGKVRSENASSSRRTALIKDSVLYELDNEKKTYFVADDAAMKKAANEAAAAMKEMQERVKKMPPAQRELMEQSVGMHMPGVFGRKDIFELKDTGKNETVEGRECRVWNLLKNGANYHEFCVVPFTSLPGKEDVVKANKGLSRGFMFGPAGLTSAVDYYAVRNSVAGYPVRVRMIDDTGQPLASEFVLTKWVVEFLPESTFEIPAGYQKVAPPKSSF